MIARDIDEKKNFKIIETLLFWSLECHDLKSANQNFFGRHVTEIDRKFQGWKSQTYAFFKSLKIWRRVQFGKANILVRNFFSAAGVILQK